MDLILKERERYGHLRVANVSDALNRFGKQGGCEGIQSVFHPVNMVGRAYTVRCVPCGERSGTLGEFMEEVQAGDVVVIDNAGRIDCTVWGYLLTVAAKEKRISGALIEGACRDLAILREETFPVFSRGYFMKTGKGRVMLDAVQVPVNVGGVSVCPGDWIIGDDSGVVIVEAGMSRNILPAAEEIKRLEDQAAENVRRGMPLKEARERIGYHDLQSRKTTNPSESP